MNCRAVLYQSNHNDSDVKGNMYYYDAEKFSYKYDTAVAYSLTAFLALILLTALFGNILVITTILRNKHMRTRTNLLLCNLAVADIIVAVFDVPIAILTINKGGWKFSCHLCYFNAFMVGLGVMVSIHTLMWISIHKFISITRPMRGDMTPGRIFCMILAAWIWAIIYNLGAILGWTESVYKKGASQCGPAIPKTNLQLSHSITNTVFNFFIPMMVMSFCYFKIFREVKVHLKRLQDFSDSRVVSSIVQQKKITKTLLFVLICFVACLCPYIIYSCTLVVLGEENVYPIFNPLAYLALYMNSACNPIIYALRSPSFRKGYEEILCCNKRQPGVEVICVPMPKESKLKRGYKNAFTISFRRRSSFKSKNLKGLGDSKKIVNLLENKENEPNKSNLLLSDSQQNDKNHYEFKSSKIAPTFEITSENGIPVETNRLNFKNLISQQRELLFMRDLKIKSSVSDTQINKNVKNRVDGHYNGLKLGEEIKCTRSHNSVKDLRVNRMLLNPWMPYSSFGRSVPKFVWRASLENLSALNEDFFT